MSEKTTEELEAEADKFVDDFIKTLPDMLTTNNILQIVGHTVTAFSDNEKEAAHILTLSVQAIHLYYRERDSSNTTTH